ncbi:hypothetical protein JKY79_02290 [Candidatus Babeliales bacterium]|nr:hypothetical protein [Candidatus Babeliales bacterium]
MEYLVFDSTRRNRQEYPDPGDFRVFLESSSSNTGVASGLTQSGATGPSSVLASIELPLERRVGIQDYYAAWSICIQSQTRSAVSYNPTTNTITLDVPFVGIAVANVPFRMSGRSGVNILDPVIGAIPYASGTTTAAAAGTVIPLGITGSTQDNFYIQSVLEIGGEYRTILLYDGTAQTATVNAAFTVAVATQPWMVRFELPQSTGALTAVSSVRAVSLSATTPTGLLNNDNSVHYVRMTSGAAAGQLAQIQGYTGSPAFVVSLLTGITTLPAIADTYEILGLTKDNARSLDYRGSQAAQSQAVCYDVELVHVSLPNKVLFSGTGGLITTKPHVVVELEASNSSTTGTLYSNSPEYSNLGLKWVVPVDDYTNTTEFVRLHGINMTQKVKFKPTRNSFRVTVRLPGGAVVKYEPDTVAPFPPNPDLQITAVFSFALSR